jgi:ComF family protein
MSLGSFSLSAPALLLDILSPRRCLGCTAFLEHPLQKRPVSGGPELFLCSTCRGQLRSAEPLSGTGGALDRVFSAYLYPGLLEHLLPIWKYHRGYHIFPLIKALVRVAANDFTTLFAGEPQIDLEVAVPLTSLGLYRRGFNQSFYIASCLGGVLGLKPEANLLYKKKETPHQAGLERRQRLSNLNASVFAVADPAAISRRHILVCDDVMTTGTTLNAVAASLKAAGAATVSAFTLARVP